MGRRAEQQSPPSYIGSVSDACGVCDDGDTGGDDNAHDL